MEIFINLTILFYILSATGYVSYLFFQKKSFHKSGYYLLVTGFVCHFAALGYGFIESGHLPVRDLRETLMLTAWAVAGVFLAFQYKFKLKILGIFAAPLTVLIMVVASQLPNDPLQAKSLFNSFWLIFHVLSVLIGDASFALACGVGILYLVQEHSIKAKNRGFFFKRLPSLELLDSTGYTCIIVGFTLITMGLIGGIVFAKSIWGRFWNWDPKEVWAGITWLVYAVLIQQRLTVGWRGRKAAILSIIGFAILLFTFFGVNFLLQGHHGEFTKF